MGLAKYFDFHQLDIGIEIKLAVLAVLAVTVTLAAVVAILAALLVVREVFLQRNRQGCAVVARREA
jgi:hypothetical protein